MNFSCQGRIAKARNALKNKKCQLIFFGNNAYFSLHVIPVFMKCVEVEAYEN